MRVEETRPALSPGKSCWPPFPSEGPLAFYKVFLLFTGCSPYPCEILHDTPFFDVSACPVRQKCCAKSVVKTCITPPVRNTFQKEKSGEPKDRSWDPPWPEVRMTFPLLGPGPSMGRAGIRRTRFPTGPDRKEVPTNAEPEGALGRKKGQEPFVSPRNTTHRRAAPWLGQETGHTAAPRKLCVSPRNATYEWAVSQSPGGCVYSSAMQPMGGHGQQRGY